jgi:hypothetical protein
LLEQYPSGIKSADKKIIIIFFESKELAKSFCTVQNMSSLHFEFGKRAFEERF